MNPGFVEIAIQQRGKEVIADHLSPIKTKKETETLEDKSSHLK